MRFTRLTARAHGPFTDETLIPAPGFTVVWGLNEAGKSSWHSAAFLAITGLTRKRGRPPKHEQHSIDRRRPRSGDQWRLEADLHLDDGDDLRVIWDLNQRVAKVLDGLGRDRSNEWLTGGAPDLARIVGLDRASFLATACVRQSDLQRVHDDAGLLQELLQKATTSADADATASAAITLIDQYRKEHVGLERENSTRPLMEARRRVEATGEALMVAEDRHRARLELLGELTARRAELAERQLEGRALRAALDVAHARRRHTRQQRERVGLDHLTRRVRELTDQLDHTEQRVRVLTAARAHAERVETVRRIEQQTAQIAKARAAAAAADRAHAELQARRPPTPRHDDDVAHPAWLIGAIALALVGVVLGIAIHPMLHLLTMAGIASVVLASRRRTHPRTSAPVGGVAERPALTEAQAQAQAQARADHHAALTAQLVDRHTQEAHAAEAAAGRSLARLRRLDPDGADHLARRSVDDLDTQLSAWGTDLARLRQARDERAGQLRQLRDTLAERPLGTSHDPTSALGQVDSSDDHDAGTVATLAREVHDLEGAFTSLAPSSALGLALDDLPAIDALEQRLLVSTTEAEAVHQLVAGLEGRMQERDAPRATADPAVAVENHEAAQRELARVRELAEVLDETRSLLAAAEDRVHRDIAPRLNAAIDRWLPHLFGDRYAKVLIDPATLDVQVFAAGDARRADLLSQGTTEQFYLLLRVALTETLTTAGGESCPLLLDEITVNFDRERKVAVLELLREVAAERQVLLFTQEDDVRAWAETNLSGPHALIELSGRVPA